MLGQGHLGIVVDEFSAGELVLALGGKVLRPVGMVVTIGRDMGLSLLARYGHSK